MRQETVECLTKLIAKLAKARTKVETDTIETIAADDRIQVVRHFAQLRDLVSDIKIIATDLEKITENLSRETIPTMFLNSGVKTENIIGLGRVTINNRMSCSMVDKAAGLDWLRANNAEGLIIPTVNANTLSAFAKERLLENKPLPDNLFTTSSTNYVSITKA